MNRLTTVRARRVGFVAVVGAAALGAVLGGFTAAVACGAAVVGAALVVWTIGTYGSAHSAWAQGLYGPDESDDEHGYADAVRRSAKRSRRSGS